MTEVPRAPDGRHRKALRAAAMDLHSLASDLRQRRGHMPADEPPGYIDAFSRAVRAMARLCEGAKGLTCSDLKRRALFEDRDVDPSTAEGLAARRAVSALLSIVNRHATRAGVDPFEGMRP